MMGSRELKDDPNSRALGVIPGALREEGRTHQGGLCASIRPHCKERNLDLRGAWSARADPGERLGSSQSLGHKYTSNARTKDCFPPVKSQM